MVSEEAESRPRDQDGADGSSGRNKTQPLRPRPCAAPKGRPNNKRSRPAAEEIEEGNTNDLRKLDLLARKEARDTAVQAWAFFSYNNGIPFNVVRSPSFAYMIQKLSAFPTGCKPPSCYEVRECLLKEGVKMNDAKQEIVDYCDGDETIDGSTFDIIDPPLYSVAYFLNPEKFYAFAQEICDDPNDDANIVSSLDNVLTYMLTESEYVKIFPEIYKYRHMEGMFGTAAAKSQATRLAPADWWDVFGTSTQVLRKFAMRILDLTCSTTACERNWSLFDQVYTKKRNALLSKRNAVQDATGVNVRYAKRARASTSSQPSSSKSKGKEKAHVGRFEDLGESDGEGDEHDGGNFDISRYSYDSFCLYDDEA